MKFTTYASAAALVLAGALVAGEAEARDRIQIVGSSTVFPFSTAVAEQFGQKTDFQTPVVESTGSGGGLKLFCAGVGVEHPDITNASRRIKSSEFEMCAQNGVSITEIKVGFDGIVLANSKAGPALNLTREQVFQALAAKLPQDGQLVDNPNQNWSDIDASLPNEKIEVLGPPPTSGTRDAFVELVMEEACENIPGAEAAGLVDDACAAIREDGAFIDAGENDNLIVSKLEANPNALGIFGFSFLDQNSDKIQGAQMDGISPTFDAIASGEYPVSRSLFFYVKREHVGVVPGIQEYVQEFVSDAATGDEGYTVDKGLIPLPAADHEEMKTRANDLTQLSM
ncbi:MAG: PstS family phosphate ABC transporter substrate-binding protein [Hyphomicrobiales bacterium]|nr:PstS family phosphate ABC transporter substrate-binding protein [Hyphomicrobiales bacterium]